jgi:polysaccharide deacetylase 2 family uncharacterized protein YibQ
MTKLHNIKGVEDGNSEKRRGPSTAVIVVCALLSGIGLAIGFGVGGQGSAPPPFAQVALKLTAKFANIDLKAPEVVEPVQQVLVPVQHALEPVQHVFSEPMKNALGPVKEAFGPMKDAFAPVGQAFKPVKNALGTVHLGLWPDWLPKIGQGTQYKTSGVAGRSVPTIALVIDDCGPDVARTKEALALPSGVTLSFLPYAPSSFSLSHQASLAHHEVIVHLPMQPVGAENPGPMALTTALAPSEIDRRVDWALSRVSDYDGANNHMGSKFTASRRALTPMMQALSLRGLLFLDSRTTPDTQAEKVAHEAGMLSGSRDVFLDDEQTASGVEKQLAAAEEFARTHGTAIVIGHPHPETLAALKDWVETVRARGYELASLKTVLELRQTERATLTASAATAAPAHP